MESKNIYQWDEIYPDKKILANDIRLGNMYGYLDEEKLRGIIVMNGEQDPSYASVPWKIQTEKIMVIHRLCIDPDQQGRGIAAALVLFAEEFGRKNDYGSIRLDAFLQNCAAMRLYERLGYSRAGNVTLRKGDFAVFEKELSR